MGHPSIANTVESDKSRCQREIGNLDEKCCSSALETPRLPSAFSKSIGYLVRHRKIRQSWPTGADGITD